MKPIDDVRFPAHSGVISPLPTRRGRFWREKDDDGVMPTDVTPVGEPAKASSRVEEIRDQLHLWPPEELRALARGLCDDHPEIFLVAPEPKNHATEQASGWVRKGEPSNDVLENKTRKTRWNFTEQELTDPIRAKKAHAILNDIKGRRMAELPSEQQENARWADAFKRQRRALLKGLD